MPGIAKRLSEALRALNRALPDEAQAPQEELARLIEETSRDEGPSLEGLAERLETWRLGFAALEWACEQLDCHGSSLRFPSPEKVSARLLVDRLDLGLRALRMERGLTQQQLAAAAGLEPTEVSGFESAKGQVRPTLAELDRLLRALAASYASLEAAVNHPLRVAVALERRLRQETPIVIRGEVAPRVVSERFDLGCQVLRLERGWSRRQLEEAAGMSPGRLASLESWPCSKLPTEEEVDALLQALEASPAELEEAAAQPFRWTRDLERKVRRLDREVERETPLRIRGKEAPRVVSQRLDLALKSLRMERGWTRKALAEAAGLAQKRIVALETWNQGEPATDAEVEALLGALEASPADLEDAAAQPLRWTRGLEQKMRRLDRDIERETPLQIRGEDAPRVVSQRLDLAIRALRMERGWTRKALAEAAGLAQKRIVALETWNQGEPATDAEVEALLRACEVGPEELERLARQPLRLVSRIYEKARRRRAVLERETGRLWRRIETLERQVGVREERLKEKGGRARNLPTTPDATVLDRALDLARSVDRLQTSIRPGRVGRGGVTRSGPERSQTLLASPEDEP
jgi:transcriptional regulator with XRE-family HTH domain